MSSDISGFLTDQLPRAIAHGVGALVGMMIPQYLSLPVGQPITIPIGVYLGAIAYVKYSNDGDIDWTPKTDTMAAAAGAVLAMYYPLLGSEMISVPAGAIIGDVLASYLGY